MLERGERLVWTSH